MQWLRWPTFILFILLVPVWLLLLIPKLNNFSPELLKQELVNQEAYEQLSIILHQSSDQPDSSQVEVTDQALVVLRSALTPEYIELKANSVIDQTADWVTGKNNAEPSLDLNDIKQKVLIAYPDAQLQITELQSNLAAAQQELKNNPMPVDGIEGLDADGSASTVEIAKLLEQTNSLNNFVAGDFTIKLGSALAPLITIYQTYQILLPVLGIIIILLLVGFVFSRTTWITRLSGLGWLLIFTAIVNGILATLFSVIVLKIGLDMALGILSGQAEAAGSIGEAIINSLFARYTELEMIMTAALLILGILLVIGAKISFKKRSSLNAEPNVLTSEKIISNTLTSASQSTSSNTTSS